MWAMFFYFTVYLLVTVTSLESASIDHHGELPANISTSLPTIVSAQDRCSKHSDCNPILRNLLRLMNQTEGEGDARRSRQELRAFQMLHRNPKIFCMHAKCRCSDESQAFDSAEQICRQRCTSDAECQYKVEAKPRGDPMMISAEDEYDTVSQVCATDGLCRCPPLSDLDVLNQRRCIAQTEPLLATSLTIGTIFILLTITLVPVWSMVQKQRAYNRHQRLGLTKI